MQRIPEPEELMDDAGQALAYAEADFAEANRLFVELLEAQVEGPLSGYLLDLGCGPADIPLMLVRHHPELHIDAVDGAQAMLDLAQGRVEAETAEIQRRIHLLCAYLPSPTLPEGAYQLVVSNSLLHHLADPAVMWQTVKRHGQPGARVVVMDLVRPASEVAVDALVETYAMDASDVVRTDFRNSLIAAYRIEEVEQQLRRAGLQSLQVGMTSDRHLAVTGRL